MGWDAINNMPTEIPNIKNIKDILSHVGMLEYTNKIQAIGIVIIDADGQVQSLMHTPPHLTFAFPTAVQILYNVAMDRVMGLNKPGVPNPE